MTTTAPTDDDQIANASNDILDDDPLGNVEQPQSDRSLDMDVIFGTLKNERRREVLRYLREEGGQSTIRDVSEHVTAVENGIGRAEITSKQRKRVYVSLYQVHLPGMDRDGVISYDKSRGTIELTPAAEDVFTYLDGPGQNPRTHREYLTVTALGGLLYFFGSLLLGPGSLFVILTVSGLLSTLFVMLLRDTLDRPLGDADTSSAGSGAADSAM